VKSSSEVNNYLERVSVKYLQPKFEEEKAEVARGKLVMN
jgi:hypothetical protein